MTSSLLPYKPPQPNQCRLTKGFGLTAPFFLAWSSYIEGIVINYPYVLVLNGKTLELVNSTSSEAFTR